jgi:hypothetical protein
MQKERAIHLGEELVEDQRGIAAVIGASIWCAPILLGWYLLGVVYPDAAGVFILLSGFLIGVAFSIHGRPVTRPFQLAAVGAYLTLIYFSALTGMLYYGSSSIVSIVVMFLAGIVTAVAMARRSLTDEQKKAIWRYAIEHGSGKKTWPHSYTFLLGGALLGSAAVCALTSLLLMAIGL